LWGADVTLVAIDTNVRGDERTDTASAEEWSLTAEPNFACVFGINDPKHWPLTTHTNLAGIGYAGR